MPENIVLCYHALSDTWDADLSTTPALFERQISLLLNRGYRAVSFTEAVHAPARSGILAVTFDDAFRSVFTHAAPVLERLGVPGSLFVPTDFIDRGEPLRWTGIDHWLDGPSAAELESMSWSEIRSLAGAGWEIGSHTGSHPHLTHVSDDELDDELARSKAACERELSAPCTSIAYPYGDLDGRVVAAAGRAGYSTAAALPDVFRFMDPLQWPRVGVYHQDDERRFRLKVSVMVMRLRGSAGWHVVKTARGGMIARSTARSGAVLR